MSAAVVPIRESTGDKVWISDRLARPNNELEPLAQRGHARRAATDGKGQIAGPQLCRVVLFDADKAAAVAWIITDAFGADIADTVGTAGNGDLGLVVEGDRTAITKIELVGHLRTLVDNHQLTVAEIGQTFASLLLLPVPVQLKAIEPSVWPVLEISTTPRPSSPTKNSVPRSRA